MHEIELHIAIDADGNWNVNADSIEDAVNELTGSNNCQAIRTYSIKLNVPLPKVVELAATLPDTDGPVTLTING